MGSCLKFPKALFKGAVDPKGNSSDPIVWNLGSEALDPFEHAWRSCQLFRIKTKFKNKIFISVNLHNI